MTDPTRPTVFVKRCEFSGPADPAQRIAAIEDLLACELSDLLALVAEDVATRGGDFAWVERWRRLLARYGAIGPAVVKDALGRAREAGRTLLSAAAPQLRGDSAHDVEVSRIDFGGRVATITKPRPPTPVNVTVVRPTGTKRSRTPEAPRTPRPRRQ